MIRSSDATEASEQCDEVVYSEASGGRISGWQGTCNPCHSATGDTFPMVDTLSLVVPVDPLILENLAAIAGRRLLISGSGDIERNAPRIGSLPGTYDPNLWVQAWTLDGLPALRLEGSAHRHILGHNIFGGPHSAVEAARYMIATLERYMGLELPVWSSWRARRVDLAWVFDPGSESSALAFITEASRALHTSTAARSLPRSFGTCVYLGRSKLYMKGPEVRKNVPLWTTKSEHRQLVELASSKLRFEVTFNKRDIERQTFSKLDSIDLEPLVRQAHDLLQRFTRTTDSAMKQVRTTTSVQARLQDLYPSARAAALMGTWFKLTTLGEAATRSSLTRRTYYRHMAELKAANVSWTGTDVVRIQALAFPEDFCLSLTSPYLVRSGEHPRVSEALRPFALAS